MRTLKQEYFDKLENYINDYQQKQGYSPSISDMVRDLGIPQTTVYRYITHRRLAERISQGQARQRSSSRF